MEIRQWVVAARRAMKALEVAPNGFLVAARQGNEGCVKLASSQSVDISWKPKGQWRAMQITL